MRPATKDSHGKRSLGLDREEFKVDEITRRTLLSENREKGEHKNQRLDDKLALDLEKKMVIRGVKEESMSGSKLNLDHKKMSIGKTRSNKSDYGSEKRR
jgi:hypothetical protein